MLYGIYMEWQPEDKNKSNDFNKVRLAEATALGLYAFKQEAKAYNRCIAVLETYGITEEANPELLKTVMETFVTNFPTDKLGAYELSEYYSFPVAHVSAAEYSLGLMLNKIDDDHDRSHALIALSESIPSLGAVIKSVDDFDKCINQAKVIQHYIELANEDAELARRQKFIRQFMVSEIAEDYLSTHGFLTNYDLITSLITETVLRFEEDSTQILGGPNTLSPKSIQTISKLIMKELFL
jgi:hypothetical protein